MHLGDQPARRQPANPSPDALWGDGFADDDLLGVSTAARWETCSPDEYVFLFPRLVPRDAPLPEALHVHLALGLAARRARIDPRAAVSAGSSRPCALACEDQRENHSFFADRPPPWWRRLDRRPGPDLSRLASERALADALETLLAEIGRGRRPTWRRGLEAVLAFGAGIHPGYLWPEAAVSHERGLVAGWLGHLDRGRRARVPRAVAEYVADVFGLSEGTVGDPQLARLIDCPSRLRAVRRAARRKLAGGDPVLRFAPRQHAGGGRPPHAAAAILGWEGP